MSDNLTIAVMEIAKSLSPSGFHWEVITAIVSPMLLFILVFGSSLWELPKTLWVRHLMKSLEAKGRHCMIMCHKTNTSIFNMNSSMITLGDSAKFIRGILQWKGGVIELIINTPGGMVLAAEQIANAMRSYPGKINIYVSNYAMSGGTLLALAADTIYMSPSAVLGNLDPQLSFGLFDQYPCASIIAAVDSPNERLAPGVLDELRRITPKDQKGRRKHRYHQRLTSDIGHPALREHLASVITLMKVSTSWRRFYAMLNRALPKWGSTLTMPLEFKEEEENNDGN